MVKNVERIQWVDVFRGLCIILVVMGHSTGRFNSYIYQFHVPAFFFISGYVIKVDRGSLGETVLKKFLTLIIPLFTMVIAGNILHAILKWINVYSFFYDSQSYNGFWSQIELFIRHGYTIDIWGTSWFILVLFPVILLGKIVQRISRGKESILLGISLLLYTAGYNIINQGIHLGYNLHLVPLCAGYYCFGILFRKTVAIYEKRTSVPCLLIYLGFFISSFLIYGLPIAFPGRVTIDLGNSQITYIGESSLAVFNGIFWLYCFSNILLKCRIVSIKRVIEKAGQSSFGIMIFHFLFFRITTVLLFWIRCVPEETGKMLVPYGEAEKYWLVYFLVGITGALLLWEAVSRIPILSSLMGTNKKLFSTITECKNFVVLKTQHDKLRKRINKCILKTKKDWVSFINWIAGIVLALLIVAASVSAYNTERRHIIISKGIPEATNGAIEISFPYNGSDIIFQDGWLDQSNSEKYRWVRKQSEFDVTLSDQKTLLMSGYVPAGVEGLTEVKVYLNDQLIIEKEIKEEQPFELDTSILDFRKSGLNRFRLVFNGERVPGPNDADIRSFSALFTTIKIE